MKSWVGELVCSILGSKHSPFLCKNGRFEAGPPVCEARSLIGGTKVAVVSVRRIFFGYDRQIN